MLISIQRFSGLVFNTAYYRLVNLEFDYSNYIIYLIQFFKTVKHKERVVNTNLKRLMHIKPITLLLLSTKVALRCSIPFIFMSITFHAAAMQTPVQLAQIYEAQDIKNYLVSKKFDGFRAIWKNKQLTTRNGNPINAPHWFIAELPDVWLDGELWYALGEFEFVASTVTKIVPEDAQWRRITYRVFDAPNYCEPFATRVKHYTALLAGANIPHVKAVEQLILSNNNALVNMLNTYTAKGGEGLMLHKSDALFANGRSGNLLKLKKYMDAEATVMQHLAGKGKYERVMGSLLVSHINETGNQVVFKIGTGFSDAQRANPPKVGESVTFAYHGYTKRGIPRFASFMRVRDAIKP